nr:GTP-binding protein [Persicimonas caeni]
MSKSFDKTPVTIVTGFLGAGKTTLVNRILSVEHGKRIAIIENEFGEVGIDDALIIEEGQEKATRLYSQPEQPVGHAHHLAPGDTHWSLRLGRNSQDFHIEIAQPSRLAIFAERAPRDFAMVLCDPDDQLVEWSNQHHYRSAHEHDDQVSSVAFEWDRAFHGEKLQRWLRYFLMLNGAHIFRMKGIVAVDGMDTRMVFQGVHKLFEARSDQPWGDAPRRSQMVFIGRHLDEDVLVSSLEECLI